MDAERKQALLNYCHLDDLGSEDDAQLEAFYLAAVAYLEGAGIVAPADYGQKAVYDLLVNAMVNDAWDNRRSTVAGQLFENPVWNRMKNQLKFAARAEES